MAEVRTVTQGRDDLFCNQFSVAGRIKGETTTSWGWWRQVNTPNYNFLNPDYLMSWWLGMTQPILLQLRDTTVSGGVAFANAADQSPAHAKPLPVVHVLEQFYL